MGSSRLFLRLYKKKSTILPTKYSAFWVENTGPILITVTLLQSMHGALLGELSPHSFGNNKKAPHVSVLCFFLLVEITGPILITVTLLQSMHGAPLGELSPHSFGNNKKGTTQCVMPF